MGDAIPAPLPLPVCRAASCDRPDGPGPRSPRCGYCAASPVRLRGRGLGQARGAEEVCAGRALRRGGEPLREGEVPVFLDALLAGVHAARRGRAVLRHAEQVGLPALWARLFRQGRRHRGHRGVEPSVPGGRGAGQHPGQPAGLRPAADGQAERPDAVGVAAPHLWGRPCGGRAATPGRLHDSAERQARPVGMGACSGAIAVLVQDDGRGAARHRVRQHPRRCGGHPAGGGHHRGAAVHPHGAGAQGD